MKKMLLISLSIFVVCFTISSHVYAQGLSIGAGIKASTLGIGADAILGINDKMDVRLGYDQMKIGYDFEFSSGDVKYATTTKVKTGSLLALYDFYLTKSIFVAAGAGLNFFNINARGNAISTLPWGDIEIPKEKVGDFIFDVKPGMKISPYLGVGFGRALGISKNLAFAFELGTYYQGKPDLTITTTGLLSPTSDPDQGQEALLESQISQYYLYPVMKFSLSYKIFSF